MQQATEVKVGIFVIVVVVIGVFIASNLRGGIGGRQRGYEFEIWFSEAPGVGRGSPVRLAGVEVGEVLEKDILRVAEQVSWAAAPPEAPLPFVRIRTWTHRNDEGEQASVVVERTLISADTARRMSTYRRENAVARLRVRVRDQYEMFEGYRYEIVGGIVFGERQLNISDSNEQGLPMSEAERGQPIEPRVEEGQRVAVLGIPPANLDSIVSNVEETLDEETTDDVKQIVRNIERATDEAAELVASLRGTAEANQGNVDRMLANLAATSEDLQATLQESRVSVREILVNAERTTGVAQRVAEGNEARLSRIVRNVDDTTAGFARVVRGNEGRFNRAATDVAATASEVRALVAESRANVRTLSAELAAAAGDVRGITGDSRERVASILDNVDRSTAALDDLLADSEEGLGALIANANDAMVEAEATLAATRRNLERVAENLRETSENVNAASRNVASLTADPATSRILANAERATAEASELVRDVRALTADPEVQENIRTTTRELRQASETVNERLEGFRGLRPQAFADVYYVPGRDAWQGDINLALYTKGRTSYHLGLDNVNNRPLVNAQLGRSLFTPDLRVRYGVYRGELGIGADYRIGDSLRTRLDFYEFGDPQFNARVSYDLPFGGVTGLFGAEDVFDRFDLFFGLQLGRQRF